MRRASCRSCRTPRGFWISSTRLTPGEHSGRYKVSEVALRVFQGRSRAVLAAYNAGPQRVIENNMSVPPINETINYVKRVKLYYGKLKDSQ